MLMLRNQSPSVQGGMRGWGEGRGGGGLVKCQCQCRWCVLSMVMVVVVVSLPKAMDAGCWMLDARGNVTRDKDRAESECAAMVELVEMQAQAGAAMAR